MEIEKLIAFLKERKTSLEYEIAGREATWEEYGGFDARGMSGGNFDDAYESGVWHGKEHGQVEFVDEILKLIEGGHA